MGNFPHPKKIIRKGDGIKIWTSPISPLDVSELYHDFWAQLRQSVCPIDISISEELEDHPELCEIIQ